MVRFSARGTRLPWTRKEIVWKRNTSQLDIEDVEHYLDELFQLPVGICIADTQDIVRDVLGYEISDMRRKPDSDCRTAFPTSGQDRMGNLERKRLLEADVCPLSP